MPSESAVDAALRVLRHRDRSTAEMRERLGGAGYARGELDETIDTLVRTGLLDDARFAALRARSLAERGAGDIRIRHELTRASIPPELVDDALESVEPEALRARSVVARRGPGARTARFLHGKGFSEEIVASIVAGGHLEA
ncbi:MAG: regulatory protein RecX [Actinobacteria bacterium]|nr:regulatory protein RecX [Actinomycetota bacterium]